MGEAVEEEDSSILMAWEVLEVEALEVAQHLTHLVTQQELEQMELLILVVVAVEVLVELKLEVQVVQE